MEPSRFNSRPQAVARGAPHFCPFLLFLGKLQKKVKNTFNPRKPIRGADLKQTPPLKMAIFASFPLGELEPISFGIGKGKIIKGGKL